MTTVDKLQSIPTLNEQISAAICRMDIDDVRTLLSEFPFTDATDMPAILDELSAKFRYWHDA